MILCSLLIRLVPIFFNWNFGESLAHEIARFPQAALLADRKSIIEGRGLSVRDALKLEWANGKDAIRREGVAGAGRFRDGAGRHGDFSVI